MDFQPWIETDFLDTQPFFITGSGRCGTTLLRRLIIERSDAVIPPENYFLGDSVVFDAAKGQDWEAFCQASLDRMSSHDNWSDFCIDEREALQLLACVSQQYRTTPNFWRVFHAIYAGSVGRSNCRSWGDKTPLNIFRLDHIDTLFPQARFIFMVRDVYDMALSYGNMEILERSGMFVDGARRWVDANQRVVDFLDRNPGRTLVLKYEDLVRNAADEIQKVLLFLNLTERAGRVVSDLEVRDMSVHKHLSNALVDVRADSIGKGRAILPIDIREEILSISLSLQSRFGYEG